MHDLEADLREAVAGEVRFDAATRAAYATDVAAMKLLLAYGADPNAPTIKPPPRQRGRGGVGATASSGGPGSYDGTAAAPRATTSTKARPNPAPVASSAASDGTIQERTNASINPGTTSDASGTAMRFVITPIGATVPNAKALIGAVHSVATAAGAT